MQLPFECFFSAYDNSLTTFPWIIQKILTTNRFEWPALIPGYPKLSKNIQFEKDNHLPFQYLRIPFPYLFNIFNIFEKFARLL